MNKTVIHQQLILLATTAILAIGCDEDERVARVAIEAANRQAQQNTEMARLSRNVSELQRGVQTQQTEIGQQRNSLEAERRQIAKQRLTESRLGPILKTCAAAAVCTATIGFCWSLLLGLRREDGADQTLNELLIHELASDSPAILPSLLQQPGDTRQTLPADDPEPSRLLPSE